MAVTLTLTGKTPGQTQFGLDTFMEHYKCDATANIVLTDSSVPAIGAAHPVYTGMFVSDRHCAETSESASALDLVYVGTLIGSGELDLPLGKATQGTAIGSASSSSSFFNIYTLSSAATLQFYAPTNSLTWVSRTAGTEGPSGPVIAPTGDLVIFAFTFPPPFPLFSGNWYDFILSNFFTIETTTIVQSTEIVVGGKYWQNVATASKIYVPATIIV